MVSEIEAVLIGLGIVVGIPFVIGFWTRTFATVFNTKAHQEGLETQEGERQDKKGQ